MHYRYLNANDFAFLSKIHTEFPHSKFLEWLEICGIKYYLYCRRSSGGYVKRKYYVYCDKKFLLTRMKYDF